ncbi:MAG TPA: PAS domain-containing protein [Vicinamibacterales bacterium]
MVISLHPSVPNTGPPQVDDEADVVKRRRLPLNEFAPGDQHLADAYAYWVTKRRDGLLPSRKDIDVLNLRPLIGWMHIVDTSAPDAADYRYRLFGTAIRLERLWDFRNFRIGDYPSKVYRQMLLEDYGAVAFSGVPSYHHVVAMLGYIRYSYSRLILPMAEDGRRVDTLLVCINKRTFDDFTL